MAGTDQTRKDEALREAGPAVILVAPQLGENIGTAARAMLNFGLTDLRLVRPRDGWPNERARAAASGADEVIDGARLFATTAEAIADLDYVIATTARSRDMVKPILTPETAATQMRVAFGAGGRAGLLFGPERTGLENDDIVLADALMMVPVNPAFASLNLAQCVLLMSYEWHKAGDATEAARIEYPQTRPATKEELVGFFHHLEGELDRFGFLKPPEKRPSMIRNLRNMFQRAVLTEQEVRTLRGVVAALTRRYPKGEGPPD
ncbi:RNA methyltransferase, TrmH family, group 1 [Parvibaculum lavamentivorans DS-1]|uniref:tRNA (cytidine/uridine-2'-O-)-methyltransferase TrmJ n=1 Tax=Parvibaculum lavamentivorans (strain DS-1 / DSM 13023 / NCIMB 13966) TaxID=402881 RepID=A7HWA7_PARL1|nr:RNA methyltransferase [Parvibaculum lavamentivorans]ABS64190.1 RNA methyltransferase, TrmH family, group 1 [Parvibaculum lavamentivorans DS-1]